MRRIPIILMIFPLAWAAAAWAQREPAAVRVAERVDARYNGLRSLRMAFVETFRGGGRDRAESGTLWLQPPGRMRWEYRSPKEKLFVADGKTAYFYVPGEGQARKAPLKKLDDVRSPLRFLLGRAKLTRDIEGLHLADTVTTLQPGNTVLAGVPRHLSDRVHQVLIEVTPGAQIVRLAIEDLDGTVTEFRFSDIAENVLLKDELFRFQPPRGVEVIDSPDFAD
jgi:outer membrane lipoprotein carrier protein